MSSSQLEEKLIKSLEQLSLQNSSTESPAQEGKQFASTLNRAEKLSCISVIGESILAPSIIGKDGFPQHLSVTIRSLIGLQDDADHDVKIAADEEVNRIIKKLWHSHTQYLLYGLFLEVKNNGPARCVCAALKKFAHLANYIKSSRCRLYLQSVLPVLHQLCQREEESVQEALVEALPKLGAHLFFYATDTEIQELLGLLVSRLSGETAASRRTAADMIGSTCQNVRQPYPIITWLLEILVDTLIPAQDSVAATTTATINGVLLAIRQLMACLERLLSTSQSAATGEPPIRKDLLAGVVEVLTHHITKGETAGLVGAALEALTQLLRTGSPGLEQLVALRDGMKGLVSIFDQGDDQKSRGMSRTQSYTSETRLSTLRLSVSEAEEDLEQALLDPGGLVPPSGLLCLPETAAEEDGYDSGEDVSGARSKDTPDLDALEGMEESLALPESPYPLVREETSDVEEKEHTGDSGIASSAGEGTVSPSLQATAPSRLPTVDARIGTLMDPNSWPSLYCARLISYRCLLCAYQGSLRSDREVQASLKVSALSCLGQLARLSPGVLLKPLFVETRAENGETATAQALSDVFLFSRHSDPQVKGQTCFLIGHFLAAASRAALCHGIDSWITNQSQSPTVSVRNLIGYLEDVLCDQTVSGLAVKSAVSALHLCANQLLGSADAHLLLPVIGRCMAHVTHSYRLVRRELLFLLGLLDYRLVHAVEKAVDGARKLSLVKAPDLQCQSLEVVWTLLSECDPSLRKAAAEALCEMVPHLFLPHCGCGEGGVVLAERLDTCCQQGASSPALSVHPNLVIPLLPGVTSGVDLRPCLHSSKGHLSSNLHWIVHSIVDRLLTVLPLHSERDQLYGLIGALNCLIQHFPIRDYPLVWGTLHPAQLRAHDLPYKWDVGHTPNLRKSSMQPLLLHCMALMTSAPALTDIHFHIDLLQLTASLLLSTELHSLMQDSKQRRPSLGSTNLKSSGHGLQFIGHLAKLLCIFWHILTDTNPTLPAHKVVLPNLTSPGGLSPGKKRRGAGGKVPDIGVASPAKGKKEKETSDFENRPVTSKDNLGYFYSMSHYLKLHDILKVSYKSYLISPDIARPIRLLEVCLSTLGEVLEVIRFDVAAEHAEEMLVYLNSLYIVEPVASIHCAAKLLRAVFGTNLLSQWDETLATSYSKLLSGPRHTDQPVDNGVTLEDGVDHKTDSSGSLSSLLRLPAALTTASLVEEGPLLQGFLKEASLEGGSSLADRRPWTNLFVWTRKASERRTPACLRDPVTKGNLANYIHLFEPMVIRSLRHYPIASSPAVQTEVVDMLCQLIYLRVNYCQLDSEKRFLHLLVDQIDRLELGQLRNAPNLVSCLFYLLTLLTYERAAPRGNEPVMRLAAVIHLVETLLAGEFDRGEVILPAVRHLVADLFVHRAVWIHSSGGYSLLPGHSSMAELEAQREVLLKLLTVQLIEEPGCWELLQLVVRQAAREWLEKWRCLSGQLWAILVDGLSKGSLRLERPHAVVAMGRLLATLSVDSCPWEKVVWLMFVPVPGAENEAPQRGLHLAGWSGRVIVLLRLLMCHCEEEDWMRRQEEVAPGLHWIGALHEKTEIQEEEDLRPEVAVVSLLLHLLSALSSQIHCQLLSADSRVDASLCQHLADLQLSLLHLIRSGQFHRIRAAVTDVMSDVKNSMYRVIERITSDLLKVSTTEPHLCVLWMQILSEIGSTSDASWSQVLNEQPNATTVPFLNQEIVRKSTLLFYVGLMVDRGGLSRLVTDHLADLLTLDVKEPQMVELQQALQQDLSGSLSLVAAVDAYSQETHETSLLVTALRWMRWLHVEAGCHVLELVIDRFVRCRCPGIVGSAEDVACQRIDAWIECKPEDLKSLSVTLAKVTDWTSRLANRSRRLETRLSRLKKQLSLNSPIHPSEETTHKKGTIQRADKTWYLHLVHSTLSTPSSPLLLPHLLQHLHPEDQVHLLQQHCSSTERRLAPHLLAQCLRLGCSRTLAVFGSGAPDLGEPIRSASGSMEMGGPKIDRLFIAAEDVLVSTVCGLYESGEAPALSVAQWEAWSGHAIDLCTGLTCYLNLVPRLPIPVPIPDQVVPAIPAFLMICVRSLGQHLENGGVWDTLLVQAVLDLLISMFTTRSLLDVLASEPIQTEQLPTLVDFIFNLAFSGLLSAGTRRPLLSLGEDPVELAKIQTQRLLEVVMTGEMQDPRWTLKSKLRVVVIGLSRIPLLASAPVSLAPHDRPDNDIVARMTSRTAFSGWTGGKRGFEEAWAGFLGFLARNEVDEEGVDALEVEEGRRELRKSTLSEMEQIEQTQCRVMAVRGLSRLLLDTSARPDPGNPLVSRLDHRPRDSVPNFCHTRLGRKLSAAHSIVTSVLHSSLCREGDSSYEQGVMRNLERAFDSPEYGYGQCGLDIMLRRLMESGSTHSSGDDSPLDLPSCLHSLPLLLQPWLQVAGEGPRPPLALRAAAMHTAVLATDLGADREQLEWIMDTLILAGGYAFNEDDLLTSWLTFGLAKVVSLLEGVRRRQHGAGEVTRGLDQSVRWVESALQSPLSVAQDGALQAAMMLLQIDCGAAGSPGGDSHAAVTASMLPQLVSMHNQVINYLEGSLSHLAAPRVPAGSVTPSTAASTPAQTTLGFTPPVTLGSAVGAIAGASTTLKQSRGVPSHILSNLHLSANNEHHQLTVLAAACFYCERHPEALRETDLLSALVTAARQWILGPDKDGVHTGGPTCSFSVYLALIRGLERLVLTERLPRITVEVLTRMSMDRLRYATSPHVSLPALGLFITCVYTTAGGGAATPPRRMSGFDTDPELRLVDMERVSHVVQRLTSGAAVAPEALCLARLLPRLLLDFFPEDQAVNRSVQALVGSVRHAYPVLAARVLFQVFGRLLNEGRSDVVREWSLLSLKNLVDREPPELAVWTTTVLLISSSTNTYLRAAFPLCLSRKGQLDSLDTDLLCVAGIEYVSQSLSEAQDRTTFFDAVAERLDQPAFRTLHSLARQATSDRF